MFLLSYGLHPRCLTWNAGPDRFKSLPNNVLSLILCSTVCSMLWYFAMQLIVFASVAIYKRPSSLCTWLDHPKQTCISPIITIFRQRQSLDSLSTSPENPLEDHQTFTPLLSASNIPDPL